MTPRGTSKEQRKKVVVIWYGVEEIHRGEKKMAWWGGKGYHKQEVGLFIDSLEKRRTKGGQKKPENRQECNLEGY